MRTSIWAQYWPNSRCQYLYQCIPRKWYWYGPWKKLVSQSLARKSVHAISYLYITTIHYLLSTFDDRAARCLITVPFWIFTMQCKRYYRKGFLGSSYRHNTLYTYSIALYNVVKKSYGIIVRDTMTVIWFMISGNTKFA